MGFEVEKGALELMERREEGFGRRTTYERLVPRKEKGFSPFEVPPKNQTFSNA